MGLTKRLRRSDFCFSDTGQVIFKIHQKSPLEFAQYHLEVKRSRRRGACYDVGDVIMSYYHENGGLILPRELDFAADFFDSDLETSCLFSSFCLDLAKRYSNPPKNLKGKSSHPFFGSLKRKENLSSVDYFNMALNLASRANEDIERASEILSDYSDLQFFNDSKKQVHELRRMIRIYFEFSDNAQRVLFLEDSLKKAKKRGDILKISRINQKINSLTELNVK